MLEGAGCERRCGLCVEFVMLLLLLDGSVGLLVIVDEKVVDECEGSAGSGALRISTECLQMKCIDDVFQQKDC